jgi:hypothetical protein
LNKLHIEKTKIIKNQKIINNYYHLVLETLKNYTISSEKKNDFEEEIKKIDEKLENFKEKVSEVKI